MRIFFYLFYSLLDGGRSSKTAVVVKKTWHTHPTRLLYTITALPQPLSFFHPSIQPSATARGLFIIIIIIIVWKHGVIAVACDGKSLGGRWPAGGREEEAVSPINLLFCPTSVVVLDVPCRPCGWVWKIYVGMKNGKMKGEKDRKASFHGGHDRDIRSFLCVVSCCFFTPLYFRWCIFFFCFFFNLCKLDNRFTCFQPYVLSKLICNAVATSPAIMVPRAVLNIPRVFH